MCIFGKFIKLLENQSMYSTVDWDQTPNLTPKIENIIMKWQPNFFHCLETTMCASKTNAVKDCLSFSTFYAKVVLCSCLQWLNE